MIAVIAFTRRGCQLGQRLAQQLGGTLWAPERLTADFGAQAYDSLSCWTASRFAQGDQIIFVSAAGIAVRSIAPYVADKMTDPPVVSVDEEGRFAIPLLSGHVGGANQLACQVAALTGGQAAISTATDLNGVFAVDVWAKENHLALVERTLAKEVSARLLEGESVGLVSTLPWEGTLPPQLLEGEPLELGIYVGTSIDCCPYPKTLHLLPQDVILGVGCKRGTSAQQLEEQIQAALSAAACHPRRVCGVATIDRKQDEAGLLTLCQTHRWPLLCYTAQELSQVPGDFTTSPFVAAVTGVDNVCERAAVCAGGQLILPKQAGHGVTVALSRRPLTIRF